MKIKFTVYILCLAFYGFLYSVGDREPFYIYAFLGAIPFLFNLRMVHFLALQLIVLYPLPFIIIRWYECSPIYTNVGCGLEGLEIFYGILWIPIGALIWGLLALFLYRSKKKKK